MLVSCRLCWEPFGVIVIQCAPIGPPYLSCPRTATNVDFDFMVTVERLSEVEVSNAFHGYLKSSLTQAKTERLLDAELLSSAEADLMITGACRAIHPSSSSIKSQNAKLSSTQGLHCVYISLLYDARQSLLLCPYPEAR